jgi:hypothetical protein
MTRILAILFVIVLIALIIVAVLMIGDASGTTVIK